MEEAERLCDRVAILDHGRIIDLDAPAALVRRHCPERTVVVSTGDLSADARLRALPAVASVSRLDRLVTVQGRGDDLVTSVIECLAAHGTCVTDLHTVSPTLEDVFLRLTGSSIRD